LFTITTNGFVRDNIFDKQYEYAKKIIYGEEENKRFLPFIYELDSIDEWDKEECWIKANPGIDTIKSRDYLRQMVAKAKADSSFKPTVLVKDFNMKQNSEDAWLSWEELNNEELIPDYKYRYFIGGFDAADYIDLNAAQAIFKKPNDENLYVKSMYWIPESVIEEQGRNGDRKERDSVPYSQWIADGLMRTCAGNKVNKRVILDWFIELRDKHDIYPYKIGYDPWHISDELIEAFEQEFGKGVLIPIRQGVITLSQPMKNLKAEFQQHHIVYGNNPINKWCFFNSAIKTDVNDNIQLVKKANRTQRIDGMAALLDAYVVYYNNADEFETLI
jgi:phage terminase large subunit-like protein